MANFIRLYPVAREIQEIRSLLLSAGPNDFCEAAATLENYLTISEIEEIHIGSLHIFRGDAAPSSQGRPGTQSVELKVSVGTIRPGTQQNLQENTDSEIQQDEDNSTESPYCRDSVCSTEPRISQNLPSERDSAKYPKPSRSESSKGTRFHQRSLGTETPESPNPPLTERDSGNEEQLPVTGNKYISNKSFYSVESGTGGGTESNERQDSVEFARILASLLENTDAQGAIKSYSNLLEQFGKQTAAAALIATLVRKSAADKMGPLTKPGGYFTQRCRKYAANGISEEILEDLNRYREFPFSELEDRIRADVQGQPLQAGTTSLSSREVPRRGKPMSTREQAEALRKQIASDDPTVTVHPVREVSSPSGVEYVVDIHLDGHPYTLTSLEDWDSHYRAVQELMARLQVMGDRASTCAVT